MISLLLVACGGGTAPVAEPAPVPEPPVVVAEPAPVAPAAAHPANDAALLALLPADAPRQPIVNELSGETDGTSVTLAAPFAVDGVPCAAGDVMVGTDRWGCTLAEAVTWRDRTWTAGTWHGRHYGTDTPIGLVLAAEETTTVDGVPCREFVHLLPSGRLERCTLAAEHTAAGLTFHPGSQVTFDETGAPIDAVLYDTHTFGGTAYGAGMFAFSGGVVTEHAEGVFGD